MYRITKFHLFNQLTVIDEYFSNSIQFSKINPYFLLDILVEQLTQ